MRVPFQKTLGTKKQRGSPSPPARERRARTSRACCTRPRTFARAPATRAAKKKASKSAWRRASAPVRRRTARSRLPRGTSWASRVTPPGTSRARRSCRRRTCARARSRGTSGARAPPDRRAPTRAATPATLRAPSATCFSFWRRRAPSVSGARRVASFYATGPETEIPGRLSVFPKRSVSTRMSWSSSSPRRAGGARSGRCRARAARRRTPRRRTRNFLSWRPFAGTRPWSARRACAWARRGQPRGTKRSCAR